MKRALVSVDRRAADVGESAIELSPRQKITVHDLLEASLIQPSNDAADALALSIPSSYPAFATLMNAKAKQLGLDRITMRASFVMSAAVEYSPGESRPSGRTKCVFESLAAWGLAQFRTVLPVQPGRTYATMTLPYGRASLDLVAQQPLRLVVHLGRPLSATIVAPRVARLPVHRGDPLGRVEIRYDGKLIGSRVLVASRTVKRPGLAGRLGFYSRRALHHLGHPL